MSKARIYGQKPPVHPNVVNKKQDIIVNNNEYYMKAEKGRTLLDRNKHRLKNNSSHHLVLSIDKQKLKRPSSSLQKAKTYNGKCLIFSSLF